MKWMHRSHLSKSLFGVKTANLCTATSRGGNVPDGFALSVSDVNSIVNSSLSQSEYDSLVSSFNVLLLRSSSGKVAVRSSSIYEGGRHGYFSGLFASQLCVESLEGLIDAIERTFHSARSSKIVNYFEKKKLNPDSDHMGILVQEQVDYDLAGVAYIKGNHIRCEFAESCIANMIDGRSMPSFIINFYRKDSESDFSLEIEKDISDVDVFEGFYPLIYRSFHSIVKEEESAIIEFCLKDRELYVLQVNYGAYIDSSDVHSCEYFGNTQILGLKSAAMRYFVDSGLFEKPTLIFSNNVSLDQISKEALSFFHIQTPITVRFSCEQRLGLPRFFCSNIEEALRYVEMNREAGWSVILHESLEVKRSFELQIQSDSWYLEHVPGMWESDSQVFPDIIHFNKNKCFYYRCKGVRRCKFTDFTGSYNEDIDRIDIQLFKKWEQRVFQVVALVRDQFTTCLPINLHFVEDASGAWFF